MRSGTSWPICLLPSLCWARIAACSNPWGFPPWLLQKHRRRCAWILALGWYALQMWGYSIPFQQLSLPTFKHCAYGQFIHEVEHVSFTPLVLSATGGGVFSWGLVSSRKVWLAFFHQVGRWVFCCLGWICCYLCMLCNPLHSQGMFILVGLHHQWLWASTLCGLSF